MSLLTEELLRVKARHPEVPIQPLREAMLTGIEAFAWMKDGTTYVGTTGKRLAEARAELEQIK